MPTDTRVRWMGDSDPGTDHPLTPDNDHLAYEDSPLGESFWGAGGNDELHGGKGDDDLFGAAGNDEVHGGPGLDYIEGGSGNDHIIGNAGSDFLGGGEGDDELYGNDGNDELFGDEGDDYQKGGKGNDTLKGGLGADTLHGSAGKDDLYGGEGDDHLGGGTGADRFYFDADIMGGTDTLPDFNRKQDQIHVSGVGLDDISQVGPNKWGFDLTGDGSLDAYVVGENLGTPQYAFDHGYLILGP